MAEQVHSVLRVLALIDHVHHEAKLVRQRLEVV
jgi:hypothetical protein